jgi:hypothetical protein
VLGIDLVLSGGEVLVIDLVPGIGMVGAETVGASTDAGIDMVVEMSVNLTSRSTDTFCCPGQYI